MKKIGLTLLMAALAASTVQTANAGNKEWATAGKILTGVAAVGILSHAINHHHHRHQPAEVVYSTTYYQPAPVVHVAPAPVVVHQPAPVVVYPAPVYVQPAPVYVQPAPVVTYHYGYYGYRPYYQRVCR